MKIEIIGNTVAHLKDGHLTAENATVERIGDVFTIRSAERTLEPPSPFIKVYVSGRRVIIEGLPEAIIMETRPDVDIPVEDVCALDRVVVQGQGTFFMHPHFDKLFDTIHVDVCGGKVDLGDNLFRNLYAYAIDGGCVEDVRAVDVELNFKSNGCFNNIKTLRRNHSLLELPRSLGFDVHCYNYKSAEEWHAAMNK